tara:strand:+ start:49357 stop:49680 length:324 start_codon:yes stop_codon:yes gene_type:complete
MKDKNLDDLESEGFTIYNESFPKPSDPTPTGVGAETKIVVVDTKEVLHAVAAGNQIVQAGMENSNRQLQSVIGQLIANIPKKPESFTLDIKRDQRGFMTSIDVKINN